MKKLLGIVVLILLWCNTSFAADKVKIFKGYLKETSEEVKVLKKINSTYAIYCSPGHLIDFKPKINKQSKLKKLLLSHQVKKKFQYSLQWEKNQLAIWDNRSMLHQATPFRGNRIMHRITIH